MMGKLPKPDDHGRYNLPNGSIIYSSGNSYQRQTGEKVFMPDASRWMLWVKDEDIDFLGKKVVDGHFVMDRKGPKYFDTAQEAMESA
jgi:hypothetical protein